MMHFGHDVVDVLDDSLILVRAIGIIAATHLIAVQIATKFH